MKRILPIILLFALYCGSISAQCDNRSGLIDPSNNQDGNDDTQTTPLLRAFGAPIYSDIVDLKNGSFIGGYLRVANIVSGRTYEITAKKTSNAAPLFITVRRSNGTVVTSGTSPLSISPTFSDSIQVHYSTNSACAVDFSTCRIQMSCTSCSPASSVSNNLCAGAIAIPSGSILNYALTDPVAPSFTLETTSTPQNSSTVYCGSAVGDDDDVWYSFTAPTSGQIVVRHGRLTPTQMLLNNAAPAFIGMGLHTSCSIASAISGCQLTSTASNQKTFTGLTAGTTYYLRMWSNLTAGFTSAPVYLFTSTVIPVELISFEAKANNQTNVLTWRTATERDVQTFDLQRSANGQTNWVSFQQIKPNGNSNRENAYTATDNTPLSISYYRLRSIDFNGKEDVSRTVAVNQGKGALTLTNVYPMPTKGTMAVDFEATKASDITLTLTDLTGRIVLQSQIDAAIGMNHKDLDMTRMATGSYILNVTDGETTRTKYIVKIKN